MLQDSKEHGDYFIDAIRIEGRKFVAVDDLRLLLRVQVDKYTRDRNFDHAEAVAGLMDQPFLSL